MVVDRIWTKVKLHPILSRANEQYHNVCFSLRGNKLKAEKLVERSSFRNFGVLEKIKMYYKSQ
jgi:hypothetical protein